MNKALQTILAALDGDRQALKQWLNDIGYKGDVQDGEWCAVKRALNVHLLVNFSPTLLLVRVDEELGHTRARLERERLAETHPVYIDRSRVLSTMEGN